MASVVEEKRTSLHAVSGCWSKSLVLVIMSRLVQYWFFSFFFPIFTVCMMTRELEFIINCDSNEKMNKLECMFCCVYLLGRGKSTISLLCSNLGWLNKTFFIGCIVLKCGIHKRWCSIYTWFVSLIT